MSITSAQEYKARRQKVVRLPSGALFKIRKISPKVLGQLFSALNVQPGNPEQLQQSFIDKLPLVIDILFPSCIVEPRVEVNPSDPNVLSVDDIDPNDAFFLINAIMEFSGLTEEAMRQKRNFRQEPARTTSADVVPNA